MYWFCHENRKTNSSAIAKQKRGRLVDFIDAELDLNLDESEGLYLSA